MAKDMGKDRARIAGAVFGLGLVILGGMRLVPEWRAAAALPDMSAGLRNADGFADERDRVVLGDVLRHGDPGELYDLVTVRLRSAPFDPVLLSLRAMAYAQFPDADIGFMARDLDRAQRIAPDRDVVAKIRDGMRARWRNIPPSNTGPAE